MIKTIKKSAPPIILFLIAPALLASYLIQNLVRDVINAPAGSVQISPSGYFKMENIRVGRFFSLRGMAYLKITDIREPEKTYRTPLYDLQSLDMRTFESENEVGIYWITFNKKNKTFEISVPKWRESWINISISNTPYKVVENG